MNPLEIWAEPDTDEPDNESWVPLDSETRDIELHLMYLAEKEDREH